MGELGSGMPVTENSPIYRFEPNTGKFETYISYGFANPHGKAFDYWGTDFVTDATGNNTYFAPAFSGRLLTLGHPDYDQHRAVWNGAIDRKPPHRRTASTFSAERLSSFHLATARRLPHSDQG